MSKFEVNGDAFSHTQLASKLWLCEELEKICVGREPGEGFTIWLYGGWYGLTAFLLNARQKLRLKRIRNFDLDPDAIRVGDMINESQVYQDWSFKGFVQDCNLLNPAGDLSNVASAPPHIIINTAVEHFHEEQWCKQIPPDVIVALQWSTMVHPEHMTDTHDLTSLKQKFNDAQWSYSGEKEFRFPNQEPYKRLMLIGRKY